MDGQRQAFILSAARTPIGSFLGELSGFGAAELGSHAVRAALARGGIGPGEPGEVLMGCVLPAGVGQAPARQAALGGGMPESVPCTTVNKVCGSGMRALMAAADLVALGRRELVVAGGMESMSNAPHLLAKSRTGKRMGDWEMQDHMFLDGLTDAYEGELMGTYAQDTADRYGFGREEMDGFAVESLARARAAQESGADRGEIEPLDAPAGRGKTLRVEHDEQPRVADPAKIPRLRPAFRKDGTVTAANSSSISDGAAALAVGSEAEADRRGGALARIVGQASHARRPAEFTTAPIGAIRALLDDVGWKPGDVDLWEINEAFAAVTLAAVKDVGLDPAKVNVRGGACAVGHPIGASGARIVVTLVDALRSAGLKRGVAALCIGGGEATALAVEAA